jgi:NADH-quinone oxidoreductase subunit D
VAQELVEGITNRSDSSTYPDERDPFFDLHRVGSLSPDPDAVINNDYPTSLRYARPPIDELNTEHMVINLGPQHPSMHGVMRLLLEMDGEEIMGSELIIGNLHRGIEKLSETRRFDAVAALLDRADYVSGIHQETAFALATEQIAEIEVPEKANWLRVLMGEVIRLISHFTWFGPTGLDAGSMGGFLYVFRDREILVDVLEEMTGSRMMPNYVRPGGVLGDITPKTEQMLRKYLKIAEKFLRENTEMMIGQDLMQMRLKNIGHMTNDDVFIWSFPGANGRGSGLDFDLRRDRPYAAYDKMNFEVPVSKGGDIWARMFVRVAEMIQSFRMIEQCLDGMPEGPHMAQMPKILRPPAGEAYGAVEGPRGEIGIHLVTDGGDKPYRVRYRSPAMLALQAGEAQISGMLLADMIMHMASLDLVFGEVDR